MAERRLFFALWPADRQREQLREALRPVLTTIEGDAVDRRNWHVTLVFIGGFAEEQIPFLKAAAGEIAMEPIRLRLDRAEYWPGPRIATLVPRAVPPALEALVRSLQDKLALFDVAPEERLYRPHVTIARRVKAFEPVQLTRPLDLEWQEFELVESVPAAAGVSYHPI